MKGFALHAPGLVLMGPSGSGKTALGEQLASLLGVAFVDGDSLHSAESVEKMRAGHPLSDADRWPWLDRIGAVLRSHADANQGIIVACSALKRSYRDRLRAAAPRLRLVLLNAPLEILQQRVASRTGHYMPASLVRDQCEQLEVPGSDEDALILDATEPVDRLAEEVEHWLADREEKGS